MPNAREIYFITLENISDYNLDEKEITEEVLINRALLNLRLSKKEKSLEKRVMLLNNCFLTFKKFKGDIPYELLFNVYSESIKLNCFYDLEYANILLNEIIDIFENNIEETIKYSKELYFMLFTMTKILYNEQNFDLLTEIVDKAIDLVEKVDYSDYVRLYYAQIIQLYGNVLFKEEHMQDAYEVFNNAFDIALSISNEVEEKKDVLGAISFSRGNLLYQNDVLEEAKKDFEFVIKLCLNYEFESKFELMHLSYNYLSQVEVYGNEYDKGIDTISEFFEVTKDLYSGDEYDYICADFYHRLGIIYYKFKEDKVNAIIYFNNALELINSIENKNDLVLSLYESVNTYIEAIKNE